MPLGRDVVNPVNGERIPMFVADYVLMEYGTGAIMAVPAHDERDHEFAEAFDLPIREVIDEDGVLVDSGDFSRLPALLDRAIVLVLPVIPAGLLAIALIGLVLLAWAVPRLAAWTGVNPALSSAVVLASPLMLANGVGVYGLHSGQEGLDWLADGMDFHITVDAIDPDKGGEFTTYPIVDVYAPGTATWRALGLFMQISRMTVTPLPDGLVLIDELSLGLAPAIVDHTSLIPNVSATVAPHASLISARTAARPAPGSPAQRDTRTRADSRRERRMHTARARRWADRRM